MSQTTPRQTSLVHRLTRRLLGLALLAIGVQFIIVAADYARSPEELVISIALSRARQLARELDTSHGPLHLDRSLLHIPAFGRAARRYGYRIQTLDGHLVSASHAELLPPPEPPLAAGEIEYRRLDTPAGAMGVARLRSGEAMIEVAITAKPSLLYLDVLPHQLLDHLIVPMLPLALLLIIGNRLTVRDCLTPLVRAARTANELQLDQAGWRLPQDGLPAEVAALVGALNTTLARVEQQWQQQRDFTADVAHALRTPLAALRLELERLGHAPDSRIARDLARMQRLAEQLLALAHLRALDPGALGTVDLAELAADAVARRSALADARGCALELELANARPVRGHAEAIAIALDNLIDNALQVTPDGGAITVRAGPGEELAVIDAGPGVAPAVRQRLFERHAQGERGRGAAGLGLAIVRETMLRLGGDVALENATPGGACVRLRFRRPSTTPAA